jgi:tRNA dimethylallyltransferase
MNNREKNKNNGNGLPKLIAIVGPTSTGKSDLAVAIARYFKGEIISADSRQIYKSMDIGTGKITNKEMHGVRHHLLSIVNPARKGFSVDQFKKLADRKIKQIEKRGNLPILAGGSGFWIEAVAFNKTFPKVPPNFALRKKMEKLSAEQLFEILKKSAPQRAKNIDQYNKRRLVRAIEIAEFAKGALDAQIFQTTSKPSHKILFIGLDMPDKILHEKILKRLLTRIKQGLLAEVKKIHLQKKNSLSWKKLEGFGLEYKFVAQYLQGKITKKQMIELLFTAIKQYSKRQRTWFKRNKEINWLNATDKRGCRKQAYMLVEKFLRSN